MSEIETTQAAEATEAVAEPEQELPEANEHIEGLPELDPEAMSEEDKALAIELGLMDEDGNILTPEFPQEPEAPRGVTIRSIFEQSVVLVASASGKKIARVSEHTATKLYELALFWAINNRNGGLPPVVEPGLMEDQNGTA